MYRIGTEYPVDQMDVGHEGEEAAWRLMHSVIQRISIKRGKDFRG